MQISPATPPGDAPRDASRRPIAPSSSKVQTDTEHEGQTMPMSVVLIVEDELVIAMSIKDALGDAGYPVLGPAVTYESAMSLAGAQRPDIALVNIDLQSDRDGVATFGSERAMLIVLCVICLTLPERSMIAIGITAAVIGRYVHEDANGAGRADGMSWEKGNRCQKLQ